MQLTKDDLEWINGVWFIPKSTFQQVVEFYEKYKYDEHKLQKEQRLVFSKWLNYIYENKKNDGCFTGTDYNDWLFNYCFVERLK